MVQIQTRPPRDATREVAFDLLCAVLDRHRALDVGSAASGEGAGDEPRDRAAGHRLAAAVLRRLGSLDAVLEPFLNRAPPDAVRHILRMGAAGLLLLETPAHAAVATAVDLARARKLAPFAGLVNAVLRRVAEAGPEALDALDGPRLDTPAWLWASWGREARAIAEGHAKEAPLDLTFKPGTALPAGTELLPTGSARLPAGTRLAELDGFAEGAFWVQDAAAAMPARLLAVQPGEVVADLCAAPGGKTAQLVLAGARVLAVDRDADRLRRLPDNLARLQLDAEVVQADAEAWSPAEKPRRRAARCAMQRHRHHPPAPGRAAAEAPADVAELAAGQDRLLRAAAGMLRPGGRLIYAVCSLQPEEGAARLRAAESLGLTPAPFTAGELAAMPEARTPEGDFRTHPGLWAARGGMDGFFAARLVKA